jgi:tRNA threonylcarbamoyl adenosine modification protein (Sua5/YciO/YrdC/YwlC family)
MSQFFSMHPDNPQARLAKQAADILRAGGIMAYPTDAAYALGCDMDNREGLARMLRIRGLSADHQCTLVCRDLSDLGMLAKVENPDYRLLRKATPGPFTFVLEASKEVPKRLVQPKRKTIGLRVPDCRITQLILSELGGPLLSTTLILKDQAYPECDPYDIRQTLEHEVDLVIDGGMGSLEATTVVDLTDDAPEVLRQGLGDFSAFEG